MAKDISNGLALLHTHKDKPIHVKEVFNKLARSNRKLDFALLKFSLRLDLHRGARSLTMLKCASNGEAERQLLWFGLTCICCRPVCKRVFHSFSTSSLLSSSFYLSELDVLIEKHWRNQYI